MYLYLARIKDTKSCKVGVSNDIIHRFFNIHERGILVCDLEISYIKKYINRKVAMKYEKLVKQAVNANKIFFPNGVVGFYCGNGRSEYFDHNKMNIAKQIIYNSDGGVFIMSFREYLGNECISRLKWLDKYHEYYDEMIGIGKVHRMECLERYEYIHSILGIRHSTPLKVVQYIKENFIPLEEICESS